MSTMASDITSLSIVCSSVSSGAHQRKHQSSAPLVFMRGIHRWPVNSPYKGPVTRKMFPFDDVIMIPCYITPCTRQFVRLWNCNLYHKMLFCTKISSMIWVPAIHRKLTYRRNSLKISPQQLQFYNHLQQNTSVLISHQLSVIGMDVCCKLIRPLITGNWYILMYERQQKEIETLSTNHFITRVINSTGCRYIHLQKYKYDNVSGARNVRTFWTRIILCMRPANKIRRYIVTSYLIGWAHKQNDPWHSTMTAMHF